MMEVHNVERYLLKKCNNRNLLDYGEFVITLKNTFLINNIKSGKVKKGYWLMCQFVASVLW